VLRGLQIQEPGLSKEFDPSLSFSRRLLAGPVRQVGLLVAQGLFTNLRACTLVAGEHTRRRIDGLLGSAPPGSVTWGIADRITRLCSSLPGCQHLGSSRTRIKVGTCCGLTLRATKRWSRIPAPASPPPAALIDRIGE